MFTEDLVIQQEWWNPKQFILLFNIIMRFNPKLVSQLREMRDNPFVLFPDAFPIIYLEEKDYDVAIELVKRFTNTSKYANENLEKYESYKRSFLEGETHDFKRFLDDLVRDCTRKKKHENKEIISSEIEKRFGGYWGRNGQYLSHQEGQLSNVLKDVIKFTDYHEQLDILTHHFLARLESINLDGVEYLIGDGEIKPITN